MRREPEDNVEIIVKTTALEQLAAGVAAVGVFADGTLTRGATALNQAAQGKLAAILEGGDLDAKPGSTLLVPGLAGLAAKRLLLVSFGSRAELTDQTFRDALMGAAKALAAGAAQDAAIALADVDIPGRSLAWRVEQASRILADASYRFDFPSATPKNGVHGKKGARKITLTTADTVGTEVELAARRGLAIAEGMALTKDLGNLGGNVCTPTYLANTALALGKEFGFQVDVLERSDMEKLGMGSALSVGRASHEPCKFIVMHYRGGGATQKPIVLVGKGLTFDTGGISLKPGDDMDMMKYDMCGGATVIGGIKTIARLALPIDVIGIVPAVENMPGGDASRPGDVVTSMSGQTIEILNTDAEGRLVLCDALTYAERFEPECVIDIATLTGACIIALGVQTTGLFANDEPLAAELFACGMDTGDRAWRMPIWDEYQAQLKSNFADMSNLGGRPAGSITAACFLSRFAKAYKWAHLDIAGTSSIGGDAKGATGRPVPLLAEFLFRRAGVAA